MLYRFAKIVMTAGLRFFYRHVYTTGLDQIPAKGPAIIIANHPSALMDAILLGVLIKRPVYFFARGDVFVNRPVERILSWLHMLPVHPHDGTRDSLDINSGSFSEATAILSRGGIIVFFPESTSHTEREIYPFRKGVFRLAFLAAAENQFRVEIPVIPIGIGYDHVRSARACVQVHAGKPLQITAFRAAYEAGPSSCLLRISREAWQEMAENALHISRKERFGTAEKLLVSSRNDQAHSEKRWKIASRQQLEKEIAVCRTISRMEENRFADIEDKAGRYAQELERYGLEDKTLSPGFSCPAWKKALVWFGFPLFITGMLINALPVWTARRITAKKVYRIDFYSAVFISSCTLLYLIWLVAVCSAVAFFGWEYALAAAVTMILTGLFSYYYLGWQKTYRQCRLRGRPGPEKIAVLQELRRQLTKP